MPDEVKPWTDCMPELLACPFCGGGAEQCENLPVHQGGPLYWVLCKSCHACPGSFRDKERAIAAWNTRAAIEATRPTAATDDVGLLAWLAENVALELSWCEIDNDPSECAWCVHSCHGGVNDREWSLVAYGPTPIAALSLARTGVTLNG